MLSKSATGQQGGGKRRVAIKTAPTLVKVLWLIRALGGDCAGN